MMDVLGRNEVLNDQRRMANKVFTFLSTVKKLRKYSAYKLA